MNSTEMNVSRDFLYAQSPLPLYEDRIQLILLITLFVLGAPINLISLSKLRGRHSMGRNGRLALLRLHLNISDLMIMFIYVTSRVCHQITWSWRGGDILCKLIKFLHSTSFQLSSNIIVCVALDRLFIIICGTVFYKRYVNRKPVKYIRICVVISWITAIVLNLPQFAVWQVVAPFPYTDPTWHQCVTVWSASAHMYRLSLISGDANIQPPKFPIPQNAYHVFHMATVFWIPAALVCLSYAMVVLHMYHLSARNKTNEKFVIKASFNGDDTVTQVSNLIGSGTELVSIRGDTIEKPDPPCILKSENDLDVDQIDFRLRSVSAQQNISNQPAEPSKAYLLPVAIHRMRNKTFRISLLLVLAYLFCWAPYNVLALWQFISADGYRKYGIDLKYLNVLIVFNSVVNPFLYGTLKLKMPRKIRRSTQTRKAEK